MRSVAGRSGDVVIVAADVGGLGSFALLSSLAFSSLTGSLAVGQIPDDTVAYAKMQNVSAQYKLLGRSSSGAGDIEEITATAVTLTLLACSSVATVNAAINSTKARDTTTTSGTLTIAANTLLQILAASGTITVSMPTSPTSDQIQRVTLETAYTGITITGGGRAITGATIGVTAGSFAEWQYISSTNAWYRTG